MADKFIGDKYSPVANYSEFEVSDRFPNISIGIATDQAIWDAIEDIRKKGKTINLFIPDTPDNVRMFFKEFECQRCGHCCQGLDLPLEDGISISKEEIISLSYILNISKRQLKDKYTFTKDGRRLIKYPCPFYKIESRLCTIYPHRPIVCRSYPINHTVIATNLDKYLDGKPLLAACSNCPESRRMAFELHKRGRDRAVVISHLQNNKGSLR